MRRARDGGPGHFSELATATARWRPRSSVGWRGEGWRVQREGEWVQEVAGVPRGAVGKQELACGPPRRRAALNCAGAQRSREGGRRKNKGGSICKFRKF